MTDLGQKVEIYHGDAAVWAARINERWRSSIESIFETGRLLCQAKAALKHGQFEAVCIPKLTFGLRTAERLMAIAEDKRLSNPTHVTLLPASYSTLAELTSLSDDELERGFQQGIIRPDMIRADVEQLKPLLRSNQESQAKATEGKAGMAGDQVPVRRSTAGAGLQVGEADAVQPATSEIMDVTAGETAPNSGAPAAHMAGRITPADDLDFSPTPPWATRALFEHALDHLGRKNHCQFQSAWEPACGEGHMAAPLKEYFRKVLATDIYDRGYGDGLLDFLTEPPPNGEKFDWIITNPPFKDRVLKFMKRSLDLAGTGVAMFLQLRYLEGVERYEQIYRDTPPTLTAYFVERVPLLMGRYDPEASTTTAFMWLIWLKGAEPRAPFWIPPGCRKSLARPDDVKRFGKFEEAPEQAA